MDDITKGAYIVISPTEDPHLYLYTVYSEDYQSLIRVTFAWNPAIDGRSHQAMIRRASETFHNQKPECSTS